MNTLLFVLFVILLLIIIIYKNRSLLQEGQKGPKCSKKWKMKMKRKCSKKKKKKKRRKCKNRIKRICKAHRHPYISWDGDKYRTCSGCCHDDDGCYDSRCFGKCSKSSFKHASGKRKRGPLKP